MSKKIIIGIIVIVVIILAIAGYKYFGGASSLVEEMPTACTGEDIFDINTGDLCPGKTLPEPPVYFDKE